MKLTFQNDMAQRKSCRCRRDTIWTRQSRARACVLQSCCRMRCSRRRGCSHGYGNGCAHCSGTDGRRQSITRYCTDCFEITYCSASQAICSFSSYPERLTAVVRGHPALDSQCCRAEERLCNAHGTSLQQQVAAIRSNRWVSNRNYLTCGEVPTVLS